jgi:glucosamine--fructose-6-phosphate aminotransferase (isomerizing)
MAVFPVVEGAYLRDLLDQPKALENTLAGLKATPALAAPSERAVDHVVLTGMGSSLHALWPLLVTLAGRGRTAVLVETSELIHYRPDLLGPGALIVAVSQSGRSAEIVRLVEKRGRSALLGVTNDPESPLAQASDAVVLLHAGREFSVSCKTYVATVLGLEWLADRLAGREPGETVKDLAAAPAAVSQYLTDWKNHVSEIQLEMAGIRHLFLAGRGPSLAAVHTGSLIIKEAAHFPAEGMSAAAFRHGPLEMTGPDSFLLLFAGPGRTRALNERLAADVAAAGGRVGMVSERSERAAFRLPAASPRLLPVLEILPAQMVTLALAAVAGREAGAFTLARKITADE